MGTYIVDIESIERLAHKVKELVEVLERTKNELSKQVEDNARLAKAMEDLESQISASKGEHVEVTNLLDEREQIRNRVTTILEQLEQINF